MNHQHERDLETLREIARVLGPAVGQPTWTEAFDALILAKTAAGLLEERDRQLTIYRRIDQGIPEDLEF